ncbi:hypothetical protein FHX77_001026 [Bifidobacterium commune]|nr:hypothetical protein [Bifidobacterium commune]MBB2955602.1 hypothetical protein [Bifidobacterium commune]
MLAQHHQFSRSTAQASIGRTPQPEPHEL